MSLHGTWAFGVALNLFGSVTINLGANIIKYYHTKSMNQDNRARMLNEIWFLGFMTFALGNVINFISFGYAAQSLLAALGSVQFVSNVIFATLILGEKFSSRACMATLIIIVGNIVIVPSASHDSNEFTAKELRALYFTPLFKGYMLFLFLLEVTCVLVYVMCNIRLETLHHMKRTRHRSSSGRNHAELEAERLLDGSGRARSDSGQSMELRPFSRPANGFNDTPLSLTNSAVTPTKSSFPEARTSTAPHSGGGSSHLYVSTHSHSHSMPVSPPRRSSPSMSKHSPLTRRSLVVKLISVLERVRRGASPTGCLCGCMRELSATAAERFLLLSFAVGSAIIGTQSVQLAKSCSILFRLTINGDSQLYSAFTYAIVVAWLLSMSFWLRNMNLALKRFDAIFVIPILQVSWTLFSSVGGGIYFQEFNSFVPHQIASYTTGVFITFTGVYLLSTASPSRSAAAADHKTHSHSHAHSHSPSKTDIVSRSRSSSFARASAALPPALPTRSRAGSIVRLGVAPPPEHPPPHPPSLPFPSFRPVAPVLPSSSISSSSSSASSSSSSSPPPLVSGAHRPLHTLLEPRLLRSVSVPVCLYATPAEDELAGVASVLASDEQRESDARELLLHPLQREWGADSRDPAGDSVIINVAPDSDDDGGSDREHDASTEESDGDSGEGVTAPVSPTSNYASRSHSTSDCSSDTECDEQLSAVNRSAPAAGWLHVLSMAAASSSSPTADSARGESTFDFDTQAMAAANASADPYTNFQPSSYSEPDCDEIAAPERAHRRRVPWRGRGYFRARSPAPVAPLRIWPGEASRIEPLQVRVEPVGVRQRSNSTASLASRRSTQTMPETPVRAAPISPRSRWGPLGNALLYVLPPSPLLLGGGKQPAKKPRRSRHSLLRKGAPAPRFRQRSGTFGHDGDISGLTLTLSVPVTDSPVSNGTKRERHFGGQAHLGTPPMHPMTAHSLANSAGHSLAHSLSHSLNNSAAASVAGSPLRDGPALLFGGSKSATVRRKLLPSF